MGCCSTRTEEDKTVTKELKQDKLLDATLKKLLLLGAGCSGKSTLFKQLQTIHGSGFSDRDRRQFRTQIHEQMMEAMKNMICKCEDYIEEYEEQQELLSNENNDKNSNDYKALNTENENENENDNDEQKSMLIENVDQYRLIATNEDAAELILSTRSNTELKHEYVDALKVLWKDPAIVSMYAQRNKICVPDSTGYYMADIDRVTNTDYIPDDQDLMLVRYRTTGMAEKEFLIEKNIFHICDVGGQRNERKKWIHFFDNVTAVLFVASLSAYNEVTFEDETVNAMLESLDVFAMTLREESFDNTAFILFLNKNDLFEERIQQIPLTVCWSEYAGEPNEAQVALDFIEAKFHALNDRGEEREIYSHVTQATDTNNIQKVFADVQHVVVDWSLQRSGLY